MCRATSALTSLLFTFIQTNSAELSYICSLSICAWICQFVMLYQRSSFLSSHLALQPRNGFSKPSLSGFWQLRVEALREALHPVLLILVLQSETENSHIIISYNINKIQLEWFFYWMQIEFMPKSDTCLIIAASVVRRTENSPETDGLKTDKKSHSFIMDSFIHN